MVGQKASPRHMEAGMSRTQAALVGAREVGFTVLSISISLIAVFIPILLMSGIIGRLFREFAVTLSLAIAVSLVVSLTTTPVMCSRLLRTRGPQKPKRAGRLFGRPLQALHDGYARSLQWSLRHPLLMLAMLVATI